MREAANSSRPSSSRRRGRLESILQGIEALEFIQEAQGEEPRRKSQGRLGRDKTRAREKLLALFQSIRPGALERLAGTRPLPSPLEPEELLLLAVLFYQRIQHPEHFVSGRDLLWFVADSPWELSRKSRFLGQDHALRQEGYLLVLQDPAEDPQEVLNHHYALESRLFHALNGHLPHAVEEKPRPFQDALDHFLACTRLMELCQKRAAGAFEHGLWRDIHGEPLESPAVLQSRLEQAWDDMDRRLACTEHSDRFPLVRLRREFLLTDSELVVVTALLTLEAFSEFTSLSALDLLRLVSASPRGMLRQRRLLSPRGRLFKAGILCVAEEDSSSTTTGEIMLAPWVVDRLLNAHLGPESQIASDERIEFHDFLAGLNGSDEFFDRL